MAHQQQYPDGTFAICPQFISFNARSQKYLSTRYTKHNQQRSRCIVECANETLSEIFQVAPTGARRSFVENENILLCSLNEMKEEIHRSPTVHAHKCTTKITSFQQFNKKAINRQDQNSWKISGKFFARYISCFVAFLQEMQMNEHQLHLAKITFACKLLHSKVKFERAKQKPLIRDRTLVMSVPLHSACKQLDERLDVHQCFLIEKAKRKKIKKKIDASQFHHDICQFSQYLLQTRRQHAAMVDVNQFAFPKDWLLSVYQGEADDHKAMADDDDDTLNTASVSYSNEDDEETESEANDDDDQDEEEDEKDEQQQPAVGKMQQNMSSLATANRYRYNYIHLHNEAPRADSQAMSTRTFQSMHGFGVSTHGIQKPFASTARKHDHDAHIARLRNGSDLRGNLDVTLGDSLNENANGEDIISSPPFLPFMMNEEQNECLHSNHFQLSSPTSITRVGSDTIMAGNIHTNDMGYSYNN